MAMLTADTDYIEPRNRLTVAFRLILAIPHIIVNYVWTYFVEILAFIQWFIIVFTGKRNNGIWGLQWAWLRYSSRVLGYEVLLFDGYPRFGPDQDHLPMEVDLAYEEPASRLTNGLRFLWIIPAALVGLVVGIGAFFVAIVSWFAILITGKHPRGMFEFLLNVTRYSVQLNAYMMLMTDTYPKWGSGVPGTVPGPAPLAPPPMSAPTPASAPVSASTSGASLPPPTATG